MDIMLKIFPDNLHIVDRSLRIGLGLLVMSMVLWGPQSAWVLIPGSVLLVTGLWGSCPLYTLFGISSCRAVDPKKDVHPHSAFDGLPQ